ncbi:hypothetical protein BDV06DRAFT_228312 [Aspergillus oleicola]
MSSQPKIATCPPTDDLVTTSQLRAAYVRASQPNLRETATRPLWEEFLNTYLRYSGLGVFGEQDLDTSRQAVDVSVGYFDDQSVPNLVFVLLVECKRHKVESIGELESQLQEYADRYLDTRHGGLAKHPTVYGATAFGTKIRFFEFSRATGSFKDMTFCGKLHDAKEEFYWDLKTNGKQIHGALKQVWEFRQRLDQKKTSLPGHSATQRPESSKGEEAQSTGTLSRPAAATKTSDQPEYVDVKVQRNADGKTYNYAVGDAAVSKNWVIGDSPDNWQEIVPGKIYNFRHKPFLRSPKP